MDFNEFRSLVTDWPRGLDRAAWEEQFSGAFTVKRCGHEDLDGAERKVCSSGSAFGARLTELRSQHEGWPFMAGNLDPAAWLRVLSDDPDPAAAEVYFSVSRGFCILPPELVATFPQQERDNYQSALEHADVVDAEIERLLGKNMLATWADVCEENGWPETTEPAMVLALGVVLRNDKARLIIDGSAGEPAVNDLQEPPDTTLPNIIMAMAAMTFLGWGWRSDFTDSFLQYILQKESIRVCAIRWRGKLYAYTRLGFGFRNGPSHQQSATIAVLRALSRRLEAAGLSTAQPPAMDHHYPHVSAGETGTDCVNALLAFLDDVGGFCGSRPAAWYSFALYLLLCHELQLGVSFKEGKTDEPRQLLPYLGFLVDHARMTISLDAKRVAAIQATLQRVVAADTITVGDALSLVGVLVFASTVIVIGRVHYRALLDAIAALGPRPAHYLRIRVTPAMRAGLDMWRNMMGLLNARSATAPVLRPTVPGEATSDASFAGWGWTGLGAFDFAAWPDDWTDRIGRGLITDDAARIWICELELWAACFCIRRLAPKCVGCRLVLRVDNLPVVKMLTNISTRSAACLPILTEIAWVLAAFDVELDCRWIDTKSNVVADVLSRRFAPDHDPAEFAAVVRRFMAGDAADPEWRHWPPHPPPRPELFEHIPAASPEAFSDAWARMDEGEIARLLPFHLRRAGKGDRDASDGDEQAVPGRAPVC